jgi:hypothetical protein
MSRGTRWGRQVRQARQVRQVQPARKVRQVQQVRPVQPAPQVHPVQPARQVRPVQPARQVRPVQPARQVHPGPRDLPERTWPLANRVPRVSLSPALMRLETSSAPLHRLWSSRRRPLDAEQVRVASKSRATVSNLERASTSTSEVRGLRRYIPVTASSQPMARSPQDRSASLALITIRCPRLRPLRPGRPFSQTLRPTSAPPAKRVFRCRQRGVRL